MKKAIYLFIFLIMFLLSCATNDTTSSGRIDFYERGMEHFERGNFEQAIADLSQAILQESKNENLYIIRGIAYLYQGNYDRALIDFTQAINLNPFNSLGYFNRSMAYSINGDQDKALEDIEKALFLVPNDENFLQVKKRIIELQSR